MRSREGTEKKRKKSARRRRRFQSSVLIAVQYFRRPTAARGGRHYGYCIVFQRAKKCARDKMRETRQLVHQSTYIYYRKVHAYMNYTARARRNNNDNILIGRGANLTLLLQVLIHNIILL